MTTRSRYRVLVGLDYATSPSAIRRIQAGESKLPFAERRMRRAEVGEVVEDIPTSSIAGLLAKGYIEEVMTDDGSRSG